MRLDIQELCIVPDDRPVGRKQDIDQILSPAIPLGAQPFRPTDKVLLEKAEDGGNLGARRLAKMLRSTERREDTSWQCLKFSSYSATV